MRAAAGLVTALALACTSARTTGPRAATLRPPPRDLRPPAQPDAAALDALRAALATHALVDVPLARSDGALAMTGDRADDDRLREVTLTTQVGASAAALAVTTCGNVWVLGLRYEGGRWSQAARVGVVDEARPGACRTTQAEAAARAMLGTEPRELLVRYATESEEGDEARDPALRVVRLREDGGLDAYTGEAPLGDTDASTGAVREGQWTVEEMLDAPRDLYVQIQPGRPGLGGTAPPVILRRTYRLRGQALTMVEETSAPWVPPRPPER